jgi:ferredoxin-NADP reductase
VSDTSLSEGRPDIIEIVVQSLELAAEGVMTVSLVRRDGGELPEWAPGAHIDLHIGGALERQYSLCGDPADLRHWRVAVLRESPGRGGSEWVHTVLQPGDILRARGPRNHFELVDAPAYLFIAGGIGITPLISHIRAAHKAGANWHLLYGGRKRASMAFLEELGVYGDRVHVVPEDEAGLLDLEAWLGTPRVGLAVYCCGPERLLEAVEYRCASWPDESLHVERFHPRPAPSKSTADDAFDVVLQRSGRICHVPSGVAIIDALEEAGVHVPRSCGEGTCGTCLTRVLSGTPDHRDSFLMGKKRLSNDAMCVCVSRSLTPRLVLDL